jgi:hypothetical protein
LVRADARLICVETGFSGPLSLTNAERDQLSSVFRLADWPSADDNANPALIRKAADRTDGWQHPAFLFDNR